MYEDLHDSSNIIQSRAASLMCDVYLSANLNTTYILRVYTKIQIHTVRISVSGCMISAKSYESTLCFSHKYDSSYICEKNSDPLKCSNGDLIMINIIRCAINEKRHNNYDSCQYCSLNKYTKDLDINDVISLQKTVYELCSQNNTCSFTDRFETPLSLGHYNRNLWYANITYECVNRGNNDQTLS